jgi:Uncharacterized membrane protein (homolog of Drosophila rhomboid)
MLSDRSYMRHDASPRSPGFLVWFLGVLAGVFVLQRIAEVFFGSDALVRYGALSSRTLLGGEIWRLVTYALLHGGLTHLLLNCLGLFFIGRILQNTLETRRLAWLTLVGALGGAALWFAFHFGRRGTVIGASGIAMTYLTVFACLYPRRNITIFLFFIIPVTIQPVWLVGILAGIDLLGLVTRELPHSGSLYGVAHSAHLGGMAAGWLFHRLALTPSRPRFATTVEPPAWLKKRSARSEPVYSVNLGSTSAAPQPPPPAVPGTSDALKAEVDRILDKINLRGFASLTEEEKRVLDEARQHLSHR